MKQTLAIFLDAYRELNAKRLFWVTMILSGLVVAGFACLGNNERGMTFLTWTIENPAFSTAVIGRADFYKFWFVNLGLSLWLAWAAMILALVSTAPLFPDFLANGAVELSLSKPIGRVRLFLTKYAAGLLFVTLQVLVFTVASFLVIGIRGGAWEPGLLLAVPIVVLVFSFLYCVCVLFGVLTRSTIAALLLTLLVWFIIFLANSADGSLLFFKHQTAAAVEFRQTEATELRASIEDLTRRRDAGGPFTIEDAQEPAEEAESETDDVDVADVAATPADGDSGFMARLREVLGAKERTPTSVESATREIERRQKKLDELEVQIAESQRANGILTRVHTGVFIVKTVLPKTGESIDLMKRWLISEAALEGMTGAEDNQQAQRGRRRGDESLSRSFNEAGKRTERSLRSRSVAWVLGTSLMFEAVVLGLAAWLFARRDF